MLERKVDPFCFPLLCAFELLMVVLELLLGIYFTLGEKQLQELSLIKEKNDSILIMIRSRTTTTTTTTFRYTAIRIITVLNKT